MFAIQICYIDPMSHLLAIHISQLFYSTFAGRLPLSRIIFLLDAPTEDRRTLKYNVYLTIFIHDTNIAHYILQLTKFFQNYNYVFAIYICYIDPESGIPSVVPLEIFSITFAGIMPLSRHLLSLDASGGDRCILL